MPKAKKAPLNAANAIAEIDAILATIAGVTAPMLAPKRKPLGGKLYELYVLSRLLSLLVSRNWLPYFVGTRIELKAGPGVIRRSDPHLELRRTSNGPVYAKVYVDIEVGTLGAAINGVSDRSTYHEIDIVVVVPQTMGRPRYCDLLLGIECKATAHFEKSFVREALGRRRELSYFQQTALPCLLGDSILVPAYPPSEYWLAFIDPVGLEYSESPSVFGVGLQHWQP